MVTLPALQIPRGERRVLGSIYGSSKPERDFPAILDLYRSGRLPLDRLISHRLPLEAVAEAFELMHSGTALRVVLELDRRTHDGSTRSTAGSVRRGPARCRTEATSTSPSPGGDLPRRPRWRLSSAPGGRPCSLPRLPDPGTTVVRPLTIVVNKATLERGSEHERITWGAAQLGIAQGMLDAVHDGLLGAAEAAELVCLVAVWVDPAVDDETAVRHANREATRAAVADALEPPTGDDVLALAARRDEAANAYYRGG